MVGNLSMEIDLRWAWDWLTTTVILIFLVNSLTMEEFQTQAIFTYYQAFLATPFKQAVICSITRP